MSLISDGKENNMPKVSATPEDRKEMDDYDLRANRADRIKRAELALEWAEGKTILWRPRIQAPKVPNEWLVLDEESPNFFNTYCEFKLKPAPRVVYWVEGTEIYEPIRGMANHRAEAERLFLYNIIELVEKV